MANLDNIVPMVALDLSEQIVGAADATRECRERHRSGDLGAAANVGEVHQPIFERDFRDFLTKIDCSFHTSIPAAEQGGNGAETSSRRKLNLRPISAQQTVLGILSCVPSIGAVAIVPPAPPPTPSNDDGPDEAA